MILRPKYTTEKETKEIYKNITEIKKRKEKGNQYNEKKGNKRRKKG
jgi:hypothetical protein